MNILKTLGLLKEKDTRYVDSGMELLCKLIVTLDLTDWKDLLPIYTEEEIDIIDNGLTAFQRTANDVIGGKAVFHPNAISGIQRKVIADALSELADRKCGYSNELQKNWKNYASTYLKAWSANLSPLVLLNLGELLIKAGYKTEAKSVFQVVLLFPTYAETYYDGNPKANDLVKRITNDAKDRLNDLA
jgi:hypothetical protein